MTEKNMSGFTLITVRTPDGNGYTEPFLMKLIDNHLMDISASYFESNAVGPIKQPDGTWRVRAETQDDAVLAEKILVNYYGLEIVSPEYIS